MSATHDDNTVRSANDEASIDSHDVLEALNAEDVIDEPGKPSKEPESPADDADAPVPG